MRRQLRHRLIPLSILVFLATCYVSPLLAQTSELYAVALANWVRVKRVNVETGTSDSLGSFPGETLSPSDAASHPGLEDGTFWVLTAGSTTPSQLARVAPRRSELELVSVTDVDASLTTLAIDPLTGTFFGTSSSGLMTIDPVDGSAEWVGLTNHAVDQGLAFDGAGNLYGVGYNPVSETNDLFLVDKLTATTSLISPLPFHLVADIAFRPEDDGLYATGYCPDDGYVLFQIDPATGSTSHVVRSVARTAGLAFVVAEPTPQIAGWACLIAIILAVRSRKKVA